MLKHEFETLVKRTVTDDQYNAIEALYLVSSGDKYEFCKQIKSLLKLLPEQSKPPTILTIGTYDRSGNHWTPNGCYRHTYKAELIESDIKTGKFKVKKIPNSYNLAYSIDVMEDRVIFV